MRFLVLIFIAFNLYAITLDEYISLVLKSSNRVFDVEDSITDAKLDLDSAKHEFDISLSPLSYANIQENQNIYQVGLKGKKRNIYGGEIYTDIKSSLTTYNDYDDSYSSSVTLGYSQSLFAKFGEDYNGYNILNREEILKLTYLKAKQDIGSLIYDSVRAYYIVLLNKNRVKIQNGAIKRAKENYEASKAKQRAGLVSKLDVYRAKLSLLNNRQTLNNIKKDLKNSIYDAKYLINMNLTQGLDFDSDIVKIDYDVDIDLDESLLKNRVDWQDILTRDRLLKIEIKNAKADLLPDLTLNAEYSKFSEDRDFNFNLDKEDWSISLNSDYSFDRFDEKTRLTKLNILKKRIERDKKALKISIFSEIQERIDTLFNYKDTLEIQNLKKIEAEKSLKISKIRYERGISSNIDILDAEKEFLDAQTEYIISLINYNLSILNIINSTNSLDETFVKRVFY